MNDNQNDNSRINSSPVSGNEVEEDWDPNEDSHESEEEKKDGHKPMCSLQRGS